MAQHRQLKTRRDFPMGFPQFTAQLITDTFNAITTSYMEQTAQYIGVVQAVSQTLQDYINNTADDISADEIGAFLLGIAGLNDDALNFLLGDSTATASLNGTEVTAINNAVALPPAAGPSLLQRLRVISTIQKNKRSRRQSRVALQTTNTICCRRWFVRACFVSTWTMESLRRDLHLQRMVNRSPRRRRLIANDSRLMPQAALAQQAASVELLGAL